MSGDGIDAFDWLIGLTGKIWRPDAARMPLDSTRLASISQIAARLGRGRQPWCALRLSPEYS